MCLLHLCCYTLPLPVVARCVFQTTRFAQEFSLTALRTREFLRHPTSLWGQEIQHPPAGRGSGAWEGAAAQRWHSILASFRSIHRVTPRNLTPSSSLPDVFKWLNDTTQTDGRRQALSESRAHFELVKDEIRRAVNSLLAQRVFVWPLWLHITTRQDVSRFQTHNQLNYSRDNIHIDFILCSAESACNPHPNELNYP